MVGSEGEASQQADAIGNEEFDSILSSHSKALDDDSSVGPPLMDPVADFINKAFSKTHKAEDIKKKRAKYPRPVNADCLATPRINEAIFLKLPATVKNRDRAWQENHDTFLSAITALARVSDLLRANEEGGAPWIREGLSIAADSLSLCASLHSEWTKARREDLKLSLPEDFRRLASKDVPPSKSQLFGDDLEASIKAVESHNRLARKMEVPSGKAKGGPNKPHKESNGNGRSRSKRRKRFFKKRYHRDDSDDNQSDRRRKSSKRDFRKKGNNN